MPVRFQQPRPHRRHDPVRAGFTILASLLLAFILLPLVTTLARTRPGDLWQTLTDAQVLEALGISFSAGAWATLLAMLGGVPLAYLLARHSFPGKRWVEGLVNLPLVVPHTAAGIALLMVFGQRGLLGQWFARVGISFVDTTAGVVVGMCFVSLPLLVSAARQAFASVDPELEAMAQTEGATHWQAFWYVTVPLAWRGILAGALTMWARAISEFGAVVILAYYPKTMPVLVFERFEGFGLAAAMPVAALLLIASLMVFLVLQALLSPSQTKDKSTGSADGESAPMSH